MISSLGYGGLSLKLLDWYHQQNFDFPWRKTRDPYSIWISEVMLQQTRVSTVLPYYKRWLFSLPDIRSVANNNIDNILKLWEGLGYYNRARNFYVACKIIIENDANLFSLGEWFLSYQEEDVFLGVTVGTGLGFGLIINGKIFTGANGMAAEYGMSSCEWGIWEDKISLQYVRSEIEKIYGNKISPKEIQKYVLNGDSQARGIYEKFGENLGIALSHVINMIDPGHIIIGGGLSNAFSTM